MALKCETPSLEILQPRSGIVFPEGGSTTPPFQIKGAPIGIKNPEPLSGVTEWVRKPNASLSQDPKTYFNRSNYYEIKLQTENILGPDADTTLRYEGINFDHKFTSIHRSLYGNPWLEVSLFFMSEEGVMFHICIPIEFTQEAKDENMYLKKWLGKDTTIPNGLTTNELFNFHTEDKLQCATLQYCLEYNLSKSKAVYLLCLFNNKLKVNQTTLQPWLQSDLYFTNQQTLPNEGEAKTKPYRHMVFDEILCLVLRGTFSKYVMDTPDPYVISDERFFTTKRKQDEIKPTFYRLAKNSFLNFKPKESFTNGPFIEGFTTTRTLGNVKCYPIDLATQVDDNGNIVIDEQTNKPIDPKEATESATSLDLDVDLNANADIDAEKENQHTVAFWIFWILLAIIFISVIAVSVVYIFRGKTILAVPTVPMPTNP
jgi:hypothetical protein